MTKKRWVPWIVVLGLFVPQALLSPAVAAGEELSVEDDQGSSTASGTPASPGDSIPVSGSAAVSVAPAPQGAAKRPAGPVITRVTVMPVDGMTQVRIEGKGRLVPRVKKDAKECKIILDFPGATYTAPSIILGAPGLGDIVAVRGGQHKDFARVVIEVPTTVPVEESSESGRCVFTFATKAEAGPEEAVGEAATAAGTASAEGAATASAGAEPAASVPAGAAAEPAASGTRARVLHVMVEDLPDRTRLIVTADGVLRYKMASQDDGRELLLSLFDVDLKWSPPRLSVKEGPIQDVRAEETGTPSQMVRVSIKLREARPYHIRRDQNQVVVEVEKAAEGEEAAAEVSGKGGDLMHRVTLNVQNEDLPSLVKALAFEAGFENVVVNMMPGSYQPVTISLRDVPVAKALNLVLAPQNFVWKVERGVLRVATAPQFDLELEASAMSGGAAADSGGAEDEGGISTRVFRLKYVSVFEITGGGAAPSGIQVAAGGMPTVITTQLVDAITNMLVLRTRGRVIVDARSNSLIITDASSNMAKIARLIRELDIPIPQVHILARLVQINHTIHDEMGINWTLEKATPGNPSLKATAGVFNVPASNRQFDLVTGFLGPGFNLDANLKLLQERGDAQLLLNPSITTLHDRPAIVTSIDQRSVAQVSIVPVGQQAIPTTNFVPLIIPITLIVRPHVNSDHTVILEVDVTMTAVTREYAVSGQPPDTSRQQATTRLLVRNRETGVIGGMLADSRTKAVEKLPILGDLPWFLGGALFRTEITKINKVELMLFLTPTIAEEI